MPVLSTQTTYQGYRYTSPGRQPYSAIQMPRWAVRHAIPPAPPMHAPYHHHHHTVHYPAHTHHAPVTTATTATHSSQHVAQQPKAAPNADNKFSHYPKVPSQATQPVSSKAAKKPKAEVIMSLKSPTTVNFERMLKAGKSNDKSLLSNLTFPPPAKVLEKESCKKRKTAQATKENSVNQVVEQTDNTPVRLMNKYNSKKPRMEDCQDPFELVKQDLDLQRKVILQMALQRNLGAESTIRAVYSPNTMVPEEKQEAAQSPKKTVIEDGFYWRDFPCCEKVLYDNMEDYYGNSNLQRQTKQQQSFNKYLVEQVREAASNEGLHFDPYFTEKKLRDRIRCFYKTHLQNAKKRLVTLEKRKASKSNRAILRVYIRCVLDNMTFEDAAALETELPVKHRVASAKKVKL